MIPLQTKICFLKRVLEANRPYWEWEMRPTIKGECFDEPEVISISSDSSNSQISLTELLEESTTRVFVDEAGPSGLPCPLASPIGVTSPIDEHSERALGRGLDWSSDLYFEDWPSSRLSGASSMRRLEWSGDIWVALNNELLRADSRYVWLSLVDSEVIRDGACCSQKTSPPNGRALDESAEFPEGAAANCPTEDDGDLGRRLEIRGTWRANGDVARSSALLTGRTTMRKVTWGRSEALQLPVVVAMILLARGSSLRREHGALADNWRQLVKCRAQFAGSPDRKRFVPGTWHDSIPERTAGTPTTNKGSGQIAPRDADIRTIRRGGCRLSPRDAGHDEAFQRPALPTAVSAMYNSLRYNARNDFSPGTDDDPRKDGRMPLLGIHRCIWSVMVYQHLEPPRKFRDQCPSRALEGSTDTEAGSLRAYTPYPPPPQIVFRRCYIPSSLDTHRRSISRRPKLLNSTHAGHYSVPTTCEKKKTTLTKKLDDGDPVHDRRLLLASHLDEPGSISDGFTPKFSHVGIVSDDAAGRMVFSGIFLFPALEFRRCSIITSFHPPHGVAVSLMWAYTFGEWLLDALVVGLESDWLERASKDYIHTWLPSGKLVTRCSLANGIVPSYRQ
ncbi:hypothetical protein PR048_019807 [Dryococelus australis]|uniref:Uncharacterized protein n=1 Tax=Dryococelus australis TaxID=614101 RepID=A0ABQ9H4R7_9NEOP|nr:hypothetical protein PR048_019807 [Dryococelus australis]